MKDNEIVKDMEICIKYREERECGNCSRIGRYQCAVTLMQDAFGLINRKDAEIERLKDQNYIHEGLLEKEETLSEQLSNDVDRKLNYIRELEEKLVTAKSEAIKEFAERLKYFIIPQKADGYTREIVLKRDIDNLVKEMEGEI